MLLSSGQTLLEELHPGARGRPRPVRLKPKSHPRTDQPKRWPRVPHTTPVLDTSTALAFVRARAAYERTMMSWIRTATSLSTFGFSVYKFFQIERPLETHHDRLIGAHAFAFVLASMALSHWCWRRS